ncbi:hypothetical protein QFZ27_001078 [Inquilinus ginsengisoli]|uniref:hypothetical protein n=1 Tax=Inquilinus ginsengisoli TaxID=363840 RepID=UPI003D1AFF4E
MSFAIPILLVLLFGFIVYRVLAPSRPRAGAGGAGSASVPAWVLGGGASIGGQAGAEVTCGPDSNGSNAGSCGDSGGGDGGGGGCD